MKSKKKNPLLHLQKLKKKIKKNPKINALLVTAPSNLNYLTNSTLFSSSECDGIALITPSQTFLFTSPLIYGQLQTEASRSLRILLLKKKKELYRQLKSLIVDRRSPITNYNFHLGFEENNLTYKQFKNLKKKLKIKLIPTKTIIENLRIIKDKNEIKNIKKAVSLTKKAFKFIKKQLKSGKIEKQIAWQMEKFFKENGTDQLAFPIIVASGFNSAVPHHQASNRKLKKNDIVLIDAGCKINGYCSNMTRTFFIGKPRPEWKKVYEIVKSSQQKTLQKVQPLTRNPKGGLNPISANQLDKIARSHIKSCGYGKYFIHGLGHGIGLDIHEKPYISPKSKQTLRSCMAFTIEPGIYIPGKFGVRIEDVVIL